MRDRRTLILLYWDQGLTLDEIGKGYMGGISRERVRQVFGQLEIPTKKKRTAARRLRER